MDFTEMTALHNSLKFTYKNDKEAFPGALNSILHQEDPFKFFIWCCNNDLLSIKGSINHFIRSFILEFNKFVMNDQNILQEPSNVRKQEAFAILFDLKDKVLQTAVIDAFSLRSASKILIPIIKAMMVEQYSLPNIVKVVVLLDFQSCFTLYDIVVPLFLQEQLALINIFSEGHIDIMKDFILLLDQVIGKEVEKSELIYNCRYRIISLKLLNPKSISKYILNLKKKYNLSSEVCPHTIYKQKMSSIQYLFGKHYVKKEMNINDLLLFLKDISAGSFELKNEILDLFVDFYDCYSGAMFADMFEEADYIVIPHQISSILSDVQKMKLLRKKGLKGIVQNPNKFYQLSLSMEDVIIVETAVDYHAVMKNLNEYVHNTCPKLGFDTEWKPTVLADEEEILSLIQIATHENVFLLDIIMLKDCLSSNDWRKLGSIFSNDKIQKLTYSFSGDFKMFKNSIFKGIENEIKFANLIDFDNIKSVIHSSCPDYFPYINKTSKYKGLSELVYFCFGKPLNKIEQCSYWNTRPLSQSQIVYAALDAFCLLDINSHLDSYHDNFNLPPWMSLSSNGTKPSEKNSSSSKPKSPKSQQAQTKPQKSPQAKAKPPKSQLPKSHQAKTNPQKSPQAKTNPPKSHQPSNIYYSTPGNTCNKQFKTERRNNETQNCRAPNFKVVCDSMIQGLGKVLRQCNIDTIILGSYDVHDDCISFYENEKRVVLTRGNVFHRLSKFVPSTHLLQILSENVPEQLEQVVNHFNVIITQSDVFSRCCDCNASDYISVSSHELSQAPSNQRSGESNDRIDFYSMETDRGAKIQLHKVPSVIFRRVPEILVCACCGKCYWEGSHYDKVLKKISHLIQ